MEKHCAVWTTRATSTLLKLYDDKLDMMETPKKKRKIWIAISESLRDFNIEMTPDQVRWKVNALTKIYKRCRVTGQCDKFKYFKLMDGIYSQYSLYNELFQCNKKDILGTYTLGHRFSHDRAMLQMRTLRLANRIEYDRQQGKIQLEKQWLEYLKKQDEEKQYKNEIFERHLRLYAEQLDLRKRELELTETLEYKKVKLMEKELDDVLQIEHEKCDLLKGLLSNRMFKVEIDLFNDNH